MRDHAHSSVFKPHSLCTSSQSCRSWCMMHDTGAHSPAAKADSCFFKHSWDEMRASTIQTVENRNLT
jgi:hypothetical protein